MSTKWNGEPCPSCRNGILNHGVKKTVFDYRGKSFEYEQLGAWCRQCPEGVLTGDETTATEPLLDAFVTQVHEEETKELARIRKKLRLTQAARSDTGIARSSLMLLCPLLPGCQC
jgi:putative zinc finger/helix-turn-helix YgiT family protein